MEWDFPQAFQHTRSLGCSFGILMLVLQVCAEEYAEATVPFGISRLNAYYTRVVPFTGRISMHTLSRLAAVVLFAVLALAVLPAAVKPNGCITHYKSAAGVMPQACVIDPDTPSLASVSGAPDATFLNTAKSVPTGSWPQVLGTADFDGVAGDGRSQLAVATERSFDLANDRQIQLFALGQASIPVVRA